MTVEEYCLKRLFFLNIYIFHFSHTLMSDSLGVPWTATCQASLAITNSQSLLKLMFIKSVMPSNHHILCQLSLTVSIDSPSICHELMEPDAMILVFWMLSFKPTFSFSSFTFLKRLFSSYSLSAIRVVSSAYLSLLIFLPAILIPACASSSLAFGMLYSAYSYPPYKEW